MQKWNQLAVTSDRPKHLSEPGEEPVRSFEPANFILIRNSCKTVSFGDAGCPWPAGCAAGLSSFLFPKKRVYCLLRYTLVGT